MLYQVCACSFAIVLGCVGSQGCAGSPAGAPGPVSPFAADGAWEDVGCKGLCASPSSGWDGGTNWQLEWEKLNWEKTSPLPLRRDQWGQWWCCVVPIGNPPSLSTLPILSLRTGMKAEGRDGGDLLGRGDSLCSSLFSSCLPLPQTPPGHLILTHSCSPYCPHRDCLKSSCSVI